MIRRTKVRITITSSVASVIALIVFFVVTLLSTQKSADINNGQVPTPQEQTQTRNNVKIGDYVSYIPKGNTNYILEGLSCGLKENQEINYEELNWRVLSINQDGSINLISDKPLSKEIYFGGALGYNNSVYLLNDICKKLYSNTGFGITARSLNLNDIENGMNEAGKAKITEFENSAIPIGSVVGYEGNNANIPEICTITNGENESDVGYTEPTEGRFVKENSAEIKHTFYKIEDMTADLFSDVEFYNAIFGSGTINWLATRCTDCFSSNVASFGLMKISNTTITGAALCNSGGKNSSNKSFVRPVITISAQITISETGGTADNPKTITLGNTTMSEETATENNEQNGGNQTNTENPGNNTGNNNIGNNGSVGNNTSNPVSSNLSKIKIGDYIEYSGDKDSEGLAWRVLGKKEDGSFLLISEKVTSKNLYFEGVTDYNNAVYMLNSTCKNLYSNRTLGTTGRSINLDDIENKMNSSAFEARAQYEFNSVKYGNERTYTDVYAYQPEIYRHVDKDTNGETMSYYASETVASYNKIDSMTVKQTAYNLINVPAGYFDDSAFYNLIFGTKSSYWVATRSANCYPQYAEFGIRYILGSSLMSAGIFTSDNSPSFAEYPMRPVVEVPSSVNVLLRDRNKSKSA